MRHSFSNRHSLARRSRVLLLGTSTLLLAVVTAAPAASRDPVRARNAMVASTSTIASQAGVDTIKRGGNAVDAAVAVAFALAVTYPQAGNLGGGGFMMIRQSNGKVTAIDYRETAPRAATRNMYLDAKGELKKGEGSSLIGYRASGVPGTVAGMEYAWRRYGSKKVTWAQLLEPARRLASEGFSVSHRMAQSLQGNRELLTRNQDSRRIFLRNGTFFRENETLIQSELAQTVARLQRYGPREFYHGETARRIAADMQRNRGLITLHDLRNYKVRERVPLRGTYRGFTVVTMPPPSSGGIVLLQMLNMLEGRDMKALAPNSSERYHLLVESMRRAFADRATYPADPDFVAVPVAGLIEKGYARARAADISNARASTSEEVKAGVPVGTQLNESAETTHFTIIDKDGNCVSNTYTLNGAYGSGVTARGTGILLNNEMDDFTAKPGAPNLFGLIQNERNAIASGKRPLSSMTPTFVLRPDGGLWFALGSPGGPTIINTVLQAVTNIIDHEMNLQQAVDAPRVHHQWLPDEIVSEPYGVSSDTRRALETLGHRFAPRPRYIGDAQAIMIEEQSGMRLGASDSRGEGIPVGW